MRDPKTFGNRCRSQHTRRVGYAWPKRMSANNTKTRVVNSRAPSIRDCEFYVCVYTGLRARFPRRPLRWTVDEHTRKWRHAENGKRAETHNNQHVNLLAHDWLINAAVPFVERESSDILLLYYRGKTVVDCGGADDTRVINGGRPEHGSISKYRVIRET